MFVHSRLTIKDSQAASSKILSLLALLFLVLVTILVYYSGFDNSFLAWDDQYYITENPYITNPTLRNAKALLTSIISLNYHPLTMLSFWANAYFAGVESAMPYIATNVVFHSLNALLVFLLVRKINDSVIVAFVTALVFAIHPMHVESVVWVSERKDVLYTFFFLLSSIYYISFLTQRNRSYFIISFLFFILACLSKAMAVSLVPVLYLYDYQIGASLKNIKSHLYKIPFLLVALLIGLIAIDVQAGGDFYGFLQSTLHAAALQDPSSTTLGHKFILASYGLTFYLTQFVIPDQLSAFHPFSYLEQLKYLELYLLVPLILFLSLFLLRKSKHYIFSIGFFVSTLVLVLQFVQVGSAYAADRYTYLPYIGLSYLLGMVIEYFYNNGLKFWSVLLTVFYTVYFLIIAKQQVEVWQNQVSLFSNVVKIYPKDGDAREYLATGLWTAGDIDKAITELEYAIDSLSHFRSSAFDVLANCYDDQSDIVKALTYYDKAIFLNTNNYISRYHRGLLLLDIDPAKAIEDFLVCENSKDVYVRNLLYEPRALAYALIGKYRLAIEDYSKAIELGQNLSLNYYDRGLSYENIGDYASARLDFERALAIDPNLEKAAMRLAYLQL
jgi:tetratricopeptide (TPR) repeat protein